jgi:serine protease inhibitor
MVLSIVSTSCAARVEGDDPALNTTEANNRFGFDLYRIVTAESPGGNVFVSPLSIALALAMTYNGAAGATAAEMADVLGYGGMKLEEINLSNARLLTELGGEIDEVRLDIANSLWMREGLAFRREFLERAKIHYDAQIRSLDFRLPTAKETINGWVSGETEGKIEELVDLIPEDAILYLLNAIYFKGAWEEEFDPDHTREEDFHLPSGGTKTVPMMRRSDQFHHFAGEDFQAVRLPYGDGRVCMYIFLPNEDSSLDAFHESLGAENWKVWTTSFGKRQGTVALPRFKARYRSLLNGPLTDLGMVSAFDPAGADFSGMIITETGNVSISRVIHEAVIEVNEEGTEAAAATAVEMKLTSARIEEEPFVMVCDRPFFLAIRDNGTGAILFMGSIVDPE